MAETGWARFQFKDWRRTVPSVSRDPCGRASYVWCFQALLSGPRAAGPPPPVFARSQGACPWTDPSLSTLTFFHLNKWKLDRLP